MLLSHRAALNAALVCLTKSLGVMNLVSEGVLIRALTLQQCPSPRTAMENLK